MLRYLLLDLDNTVYPASTQMEEEVFRRMGEFAATYLGTSPQRAMEMRRERSSEYGTTLEWLMGERGFRDPEAFFASVHPDGEESCLEADPAIARALDSIPLPKSILTNAPREHADRVLAKLGLTDRFEAVYDIRFCSLKGKPRPGAFSSVLAACGARPEETLFIDDIPRYVEGFMTLGGLGVVVDELDRHPETRLRRIRSLAELPDLVAELS